MAGDTESGEAALSESEKSEGRKRLEQWLNKKMQIKMSDGRTLVGVFLCTDKHKNVILGSCQEYLSSPGSQKEEDARVLGLAMVPGHHIRSIEIDKDPTEEIET